MSERLGHASLGAVRLPDGRTRFRVWAPDIRHIAVRFVGDDRPPLPMQPQSLGYHEATVPGISPGARYYYRLNDAVDRPDPASRYQPDGIHGPSQVTDLKFSWTDAAWRGRAWGDYVIYESHVGTFTPEGTFAAMIKHLDELVRLGVTALQLMPVAQFPGERNWGYDGVHPFAPQNTYGGPDGLKQVVDACHERDLAVVLDVVYNHLGPEGNYLQEFGPYFSKRYATPWGNAVNFDGPASDAVREFFISNALYWLDEFHVDALRLDATHAIFDRRACHFLRELADAVDDWKAQSPRQVYLIAENTSNDPRIVSATDVGGYGIDAQFLDDFQRSLHAVLTSERTDYYIDFGRTADFTQAYRAGFVLAGQYSHYRKCRWGADAAHIPADRFVAYSQSHDSIGNRSGGERLGRLVDFESLKLAAAAVILAPSIPQFFMGEEYDDLANFHFFTSYLDPQLAAGVREGRLRELAAAGWATLPPDPQLSETFDCCRLTRLLSQSGHHAVLWRLYQELLRLRRAIPAIRQADRKRQLTFVSESEQILTDRRTADDGDICICMNFSHVPLSLTSGLPSEGRWNILINTADACWSGAQADSRITLSPIGPLHLAARSCVLLASISSS